MRFRVTAAVVCAAAAGVSAGSALGGDGGSGTYLSTGTTYYLDLVNTGTVAWQSFYLVAPAGTTIIGGTSSGEASARCIVGQPDGRPNEIECGPLPLSAAPIHAHLGLVVTVAAPVACGAQFQLAVSSTSTMPYTNAPNVTEAAPCAVSSPRALSLPLLQGTAVGGHTVTASPPAWSSAPTRVSYRWQRCAANACAQIAGATRLRLTLTRQDAGHSVRLVATAVVDGTTLTSTSKKLAVRVRR